MTSAISKGRILPLRAVLVGADLVGVIVGWFVGPLLAGTVDGPTDWQQIWVAALVAVPITVAVMSSQKLYLARACAVRAFEVSRLGRSLLIVALLLVAYRGVVGSGPRLSQITAGTATAFASIFVARAGYRIWLRQARTAGRYCRQVCILGVNDESEALVRLCNEQAGLGQRVVAALGDPEGWDVDATGVPAIDPGADVAEAVLALGASGVIIAHSTLGPGGMDRTVGRLIEAGLHVHISPGLSRVGYQRMRVSPLNHKLLFYIEPHRLSSAQSAIKRLVDVVGASVALVLASPPLVLAAVAIKLEDGGPILYRQDRVGRNGKLFRIAKLRSMSPRSDARRAELQQLNERSGPLFKLEHDPRVTRVGHIIRATSVDELPQLLHVLSGRMSLVGPRPALPSEVEQFDEELLDRTNVRPGLTGLWQVEASHLPSFEAYRRLDLFYVDNWSLGMDLAIMAGTFEVVLRRAVRALRRKPAHLVALPVTAGSVAAQPTPSPLPAVVR